MQKLEFSVKQLCIVKSAILQNQQTLGFISVRFHYSICFSLSCSWTSQELRETRSSNGLFCLSAGFWLHALIQFYSGLHLSRAWCFSLSVFSVSLTCSRGPFGSLKSDLGHCLFSAFLLCHFPRQDLVTKFGRPWIWPRERKGRIKMRVRQNSTSVKNSCLTEEEGSTIDISLILRFKVIFIRHTQLFRI